MNSLDFPPKFPRGNGTENSCKTLRASFRVKTVCVVYMAGVPITRQRKRKVCFKCGQSLSHRAYVRHQNPLICPRKTQSKNSCGEPVCVPRLAVASSCMQPTTSHDDGEQLQGNLEKFCCCEHESDVESVESAV